MKLPLNLVLLLVAVVAFAGNAVAQDSSNSKLYVKINKDRDIEGVPVELTDIKVKTSFGEVAIPLAKIDGIKMNAAADGSAVIAFKNGDLVSGTVTLETIKLQTAWGHAHINTSKIETISADVNGRFYAEDAPGKGGWRFTKSPPVPASQLPNPNNQLGR